MIIKFSIKVYQSFIFQLVGEHFSCDLTDLLQTCIMKKKITDILEFLFEGISCDGHLMS